MNLINSLTAVFGKGKQIADGITLFSPSLEDCEEEGRQKNPKYECHGCGKNRVLGTFVSGGDTFCFCYNCANAMYGHTYTSSKMSRRKFYEHVGNS